MDSAGKLQLNQQANLEISLTRINETPSRYGQKDARTKSKPANDRTFRGTMQETKGSYLDPSPLWAPKPNSPNTPRDTGCHKGAH